MYKFIFNKKLWMLFKNRKHVRTLHFLALQINTKQMLKYLTIFQDSGFLNLKHDGLLSPSIKVVGYLTICFEIQGP